MWQEHLCTDNVTIKKSKTKKNKDYGQEQDGKKCRESDAGNEGRLSLYAC